MATVSPLARSSASKVSPSVHRTNLALALVVAGLDLRAAKVFVTPPLGATAIWILLV